jgi:hypothetical protein
MTACIRYGCYKRCKHNCARRFQERTHISNESNDLVLIGISCNWSGHCGARSRLETVQALEIYHTKLVQTFALRTRSITCSEVAVDGGQDGGVNRALERKRCS